MLLQFKSSHESQENIRLHVSEQHSINSRTVSSYHLLSTLLNWFKLVHGSFGQSNMYHLIYAQTSEEGIEYTKIKEFLRSDCPKTHTVSEQ